MNTTPGKIIEVLLHEIMSRVNNILNTTNIYLILKDYNFIHNQNRNTVDLVLKQQPLNE